MAETNNPYQDKIDKDIKNLVKLKAGTANQQLINAAYLGARQEPPAAMDWLNAAQSGLTSFTTALAEGKAARQKEIDVMNGDIDSQIDTLITSGFSLGENYYSAANEYTKQLREKFLAAEGDPELQNKIKMELNVASQSIAGTKTAIEEIATAWGTNPDESDLERNGLSPKQLDIIKTVTAPNGANAIWDYNKNTFVWQDPNDPSKIYTVKDVQDIQKQYSRDYAGKERYIKDEQAEREFGLAYKQGEQGAEAFNFEKKLLNNEKRITKENVNFYINGDFTNDGTPNFKETFKNHPDFDLTKEGNPISKALTESGKYLDRPGSPKGFDLTDMPDPTPSDGVYTEDDLLKLRNDVYNAVTDPDANGYNFEITKKLIAEYMTLRQESNFYGGKKSDLVKIDPRNYKDLDSFKDAGGNVGFAKANGYRYQKEVKNARGKVTTKAGWIYEPQNDLHNAFVGTVL
tara:strand:+ start:3617 stop:4996 length:1380 start_codon:yes stop_codon:yes gene_type:complete